MRPGDIRMMLSESTGIQTQQVSATSANSSIRIQGLDGRYTQLLKRRLSAIRRILRRFLGLLQTPPLDLQQVEIIKGSSPSTPLRWWRHRRPRQPDLQDAKRGKRAALYDQRHLRRRSRPQRLLQPALGQDRPNPLRRPQ